ncbi:L-2-hydroxyglutarate dehydrogenase, partial [Acrasis kona]
MLYPFCDKWNIRYKRTGKWIVAQNDEESDYLQKMYNRETERDLYFLSSEQIKQEPNVKAKHALCSPRTGIIDSHGLMNAFRNIIQDSEHSQIITRTNVISIIKDTHGYIITAQCDGDLIKVRANTLVNSAGLNAQGICQMVFQRKLPKQYQTYFYKGQYFSYSNPHASPLVSRLIYPVPDPNLSKGLGTHATIDLNGKVRFGPDSHFIGDFDSCSRLDYSVNNQDAKSFAENI